MKRLLTFLPAVVAGLLLGWGVSSALVRPEVPPSAPRPSATAPRGAGPTSWQDLLDARAALATSPESPDGFLEKGRAIIANRAASPARRRLEMELLRSTLPDDFQNLLNRWQFPEGDAGFDESLLRLARRDPAEAFAILVGAAANGMAGARDEYMHNHLRAAIYREWVKKDPGAALAHATSTGTTYEQGFRVADVMAAWSVLDPAAAAAALTSLPDYGPGNERRQFAETVLNSWHEKDPAVARAWAETQEPELRAALTTLADELAARDPAAKAAVLLAAPQRDAGKLRQALGDWLAADAPAALEKMSAVPAADPFWEHSAADAVQWWAVNARASLTPEQFLETIAAVPAGPQREAVLKGLADYGASNDIPFAQRMIAEMEAGRARDEAMSSLTELWMRKDPGQLSEWLAAQSASDSRQAAASRFAELLAKSDPESAARWADTIPDGYWQKEGVVDAVRAAWLAKDADAAAAWQP